MTEVVVAVYQTASAAETAAADLEVTSVPTATMRQFVSDPAADGQLLEVRNRCMTLGDRVVAVTVNERHASTVMEILAMQAPAIMTEAPLNVGLRCRDDWLGGVVLPMEGDAQGQQLGIRQVMALFRKRSVLLTGQELRHARLFRCRNPRTSCSAAFAALAHLRALGVILVGTDAGAVSGHPGGSGADPRRAPTDRLAAALARLGRASMARDS